MSTTSQRPDQAPGPDVQATLRDVVETLAPLDRRAGSHGEREAADWIAERLRTAGCETQVDDEYRYDREPIGALQGRAPDRVVYGGTTSKTLAPALRLGWLVLPAHLHGAVAMEKGLADAGSPLLEQLVLADLIERGDLDRHLRRTRAANRGRRDALARALRDELPDVRLGGIAAGLHAVVELPGDVDEGAVTAAAQARGVRVEGLAMHRFDPASGPPALMLGYAALSEPAIRRGIAELAGAVADVRAAAAT